MLISDIDWWMWGVSFLLTFAFAWGLVRKTNREQLANMRNDGLSEKDIERILGKEDYLKAIRS